MVRGVESKSGAWEKQADSCVVDICITTDYKALEHVCLLAEVLAKRKDTTRGI
jgi:hypothetical protein